MGTPEKLTADQRRVLTFLYENKDEEEISVDRIAAGSGVPEDTTRKIMNELRELGMVSGPPSLLELTMKILKEIDPKMSPMDEGYAESIVLLASSISNDGADERKLSIDLSYDIDFVKTVGSRLRSAGIWEGNKLAENARAEWESEDGSLAFAIHCNVATGELIVVSGDGKNRQYKLSDAGLNRGAALIKKMTKKN